MLKKVGYYRRKADRLMQEHYREIHSQCEACGKPYNCMHHYYPKSTSAKLRYDSDNLIALCVSCHFRHHNGDPSIHNRVNEVRGKEWLNRLTYKKEGYLKTNIGYYKLIIEQYETNFKTSN